RAGASGESSSGSPWAPAGGAPAASSTVAAASAVIRRTRTAPMVRSPAVVRAASRVGRNRGESTSCEHGPEHGSCAARRRAGGRASPGLGAMTYTGGALFVELGGVSYRAPASAALALAQGYAQGAGASASGAGVAPALGLDPRRWLVHPRVAGRTHIEGVP